MKINNLLKFTCILIMALFFFNSCGKQVDAKKFPPDPKERVKRNLEEGRGFRLSNKLKDIGKRGGGNFEFASSNELWRASLDVIDFMPIATANYSGGIIVTDWYSDDLNSNESLKITIRFLSNEIRADGIKVIIHKKICKKEDKTDCKIIQEDTTLGQEIKLAILKKAATIKDSEISEGQKNYSSTGAGRQKQSKY